MFREKSACLKAIDYEGVKASGISYLYLKGLITTTALTIIRSSSSSNSERSITRLSKDPLALIICKPLTPQLNVHKDFSKPKNIRQPEEPRRPL